MNVCVVKTVAFGDSWNDIEFLTLAGLGIAMKNGREQVKAAANLVTDFDNNEDGLAIHLEQMLENNMFSGASTTDL